MGQELVYNGITPRAGALIDRVARIDVAAAAAA
jgi:hypothetical protein